LNKRDTLEPKRVRPRGILHLRRDAPLTGYARYWAAADLRVFVEHLWTVEWDVAQPTTREVLTHPSVQLVIERDRSRVAGIFTSRFVTTMTGRGRVLGVKFRPGAFRAFFAQPVSLLRDRQLPLDEIFAEPSAGLERRALRHAAHDEAFAVIQEFLRRRSPRLEPAMELASRITYRIAEDRELVRVEQVVREFSLPLRQLQRLFADYVGVGPKWVIQRYRLHEAAERIAAGEVTDFADLALELAYADQAHFIRDFRKLVGSTPAQYARSL
jgi:AraC-like DNA-binding protein